MRSSRWGTFGPIAATLVSAGLAVSACGSGSGSTAAGGAYGNYGNGGYSSGQPASTPSAGMMARTATLRTETTNVGTVLASSQGMTLYYYSGDRPGNGRSACSGACAVDWPPLTGSVKAPSGVRLPGPISSITRAGGVRQVTVNGYPMYTYVDDKAAGQVTGNGIGGEWHVIKIGANSPMSAPSKGGLLKAEITKAGKVLANPHGMTVYYYSQDRPGSGVSACTGGCAEEWPPIIAPVRIPKGMKLPGPIGSIMLPDGQRQVTLNGYPLYRYVGDKLPRQAVGNGVGGEWHVVKL